jgi:hypothetical protein
MAIATTNTERERLLQLAEDYRSKGYDVSFHPDSDDLPDFLKGYRPDLIARQGDECVIVEVKSRPSLSSSSTHYLRDLAQIVEQHPGWRFELVMANPEDTLCPLDAERSLQKSEIETSLQEARDLAAHHPESAILYVWGLAEATLRLVSEHEELGLQRLDSLYLVKQLVTEGIISRSEYQCLMNALSSRNAIAHGFKATQLTQEFVYELIDVTEKLLKALNSSVS